MPGSRPIAIIGAGLVGRLLAWRLLEAGCKVSLYDPDLSGKASAGLVAAAMIAPVSEALDGDRILFDKGVQSIPLWQSWIDELTTHTDIHIQSGFEGSDFIAHRQDKALYDQLMRKLQRQQLRSCRDSNSSLHGFSFSCHVEPEGYLDNHALLHALHRRIQALKGACYAEAVEPIKFAQDYPDHRIIDCRGIAARKDQPALRGVRGEIIRVRAPEVTLEKPVRLLHPRYKLYIVPRPNHEYVIGATQLENSSEHPITVRSALELLSALYSVHQGFSEAEILSMDAKCRPAYADHLPKISVNEHYYSINGLHRHGYLLGPIVVQQMLSLLNLSESSPWPEIVQPNQIPEVVAC